MKILITGATGFIGRHCCAKLNLLGHEVHGVTSKSNFESDGTVHWHKANLLDSKQTKSLISSIKPTHLLHFAWYAEPGKYWTSVENYQWVKASLTLFEEFTESGGKRITVAGSCAEYDWGFKSYNESSTPLNPATLYGTCKHSLQLMLSSYATMRGVSFAWGRIFSIYGPHEHPDRLCSSVINALLSKRKIKCSNGDLVRDYLHVDDVAHAFVLLMTSDLEGTVNVCSGIGLKLEELVGKIEAKIGNYGCLEIVPSPTNLDVPKVLVGDSSRLSGLGWNPAYDLESGLIDTINWFSQPNNV